jgi:hypothetical protein
MTNIPAIAQLQSDWFRSSDLDRASAVLTINQSGISIRIACLENSFGQRQAVHGEFPTALRLSVLPLSRPTFCTPTAR